ncbi:MAG: helix-turn-helix protein, partial [Paenibacillus sp.]|nr:helix-turn-helix protein [Paenibacillus sp.]
QFYSMESIHELEKWLGDTVFSAIRDHIQTIQLPRQKKAVQYMIAAVHEQVETDLSLQKLVDELQISQPTLSRWFKEETGQHFGDYLISCRMEKAKEWLIHSDMPIKEISERLRYTSAQNFSRIFKQTTGVPPGSYRSQYKG